MSVLTNHLTLTNSHSASVCICVASTNPPGPVGVSTTDGKSGHSCLAESVNLIGFEVEKSQWQFTESTTQMVTSELKP